MISPNRSIGENKVLKFYIGASGYGKTTKIIDDIIERSIKEPDRQFTIIVPDQFTMQTQKDVVLRHPRKGIMNIDVQSFGRLGHRLADEVGEKDRLILDDTGKNLILRKLSADLENKLPVIGSSIKKTGYIHEVKSAISEFEQYGIAPADIDKLMEFTSGKPFLKGKLSDLKRLYEEMNKFCGERFITREEKLDVLADAVSKSERLKGSIVAFDGFTGFTPVQNNVITALMRTCSEVWMSIIIPAGEYENYRKHNEDHRLFSLSMRTVFSMEQLAHDADCGRMEDELLSDDKKNRFAERKALSCLEKSIFRSGSKPFSEELSDEIRLFFADDPRAELREIFIRIAEMTLEQGYAYRDIAVAVGDTERYLPYVDELSEEFGIPVFADNSHSLEMNPFAEFIRSGLETVAEGFTYETVIHFLRSGLTGISKEDVDLLDNYLFATGMRGEKKWSQAFARMPKYMKHMDRNDGAAESENNGKTGTQLSVKALEHINDVRGQVYDMLTPLLKVKKGKTASEITKALYEFIVSANIADQLNNCARRFGEMGDQASKKEYEQVYRYICELLEQIHALLGDEPMDIAEYTEIIKAGISELRVGVIPLDVDRVVIGDTERTRFKPVKVMFLAGLNDGIVPASNSSGGIISDLDREFLAGSGFELAPTPRQKMYIQRLYMYHVMTRPSERLVLSYSRMNSMGESLRPSYLVAQIKKMFPGLEEIAASDRCGVDLMPGGRGEVRLLPELLNRYASGSISNEETGFLRTLLIRCREKAPALCNELIEKAFIKYASNPLSPKAVAMLYGNMLKESTSSLQGFAGCPYSHFLRFGMRLNEREVSAIDSRDTGIIYHGILQRFGEVLKEEGMDWGDVDEEFLDKMLDHILKQIAAEMGQETLYQDAKTAYQLKRVRRIAGRSASVLCYQASKSDFKPIEYERKFAREISDDKAAGKISITGTIDRIDTCDRDDKKFVKIVDYKSGENTFKFAELYYGMRMQLPLYLEEAVRFLSNESKKETVPAAFFYFTLKDPLVPFDGVDESSYEEYCDSYLKNALIPDGWFTNEAVPALDTGLAETGKSDAIKLRLKKDGTPYSGSTILSESEMKKMMEFTSGKLEKTGKEILAGKKDISPMEDSCKYCPYKELCGFDARIRGYERRKMELGEDEAKAKVCGNGAIDG